MEDFDEDGFYDVEELEVARVLAPVLIFSREERTSAHRIYWSVYADESRGLLSVFYALAYLVDGGDSDFGGATSHLGDSEFIVVTLLFDGEGYVERYGVFMSAHNKASTDESRWYSDAELRFVDNEETLNPIVWVAANKHANYGSEGRCEAGAVWQDTCDDGWVESLDLRLDHNLGHSRAPLIDEASVLEDGLVYPEYFWTDVPFCGWQVPEGAGRGRCAPASNSYARQLRDWEQGLQ